MTTLEIKNTLNERAEEVCQNLLSGGKRHGNLWCAGSVSGEAGDSLKVRLSGEAVGVWADFANPEHKGDLFDLWGMARGVDFVTALKQIKDFLGIKDVTESSFYSPRRAKVFIKPSVDVVEPLVSGGPVYDYLTVERKLYPEALHAYKVGQMNSKNHGSAVAFMCYDPDGKSVDLLKFLATTRPVGKKVIWASPSAKPRLFGWQSIKPTDRDVVIVEGEIDAITVHGWGYASLSVPQGASNMEWIEHDFDALQRFEHIYVLTDMDQPGEKAAEEVCERLGRERCYRVKLDGFKDANEAHCSGRFEGPDFEEAIHKAHTLDPSELRNAADFADQAWEFLHPTDKKISGTTPPFDIPYRCRHGEVSIFGGFSGHGKSLALNHFLVNDAAQGEKIFVCSLEIPAGKTISILSRIALGYWPTRDQKDKLDHAVGWLSDKFWIFNKVGMTHWSKILPVMEYSARRYGCTRFAIDSMLLCGIAEDDYNAQKEFVGVLTDFAGKFGHVFLVCHARKREDESFSPGKLDIRGSGAITDMVHNGFTIWRNKDKEQKVQEFMLSPESGIASAREPYDAMRDGRLSMWKNREDGSEPFINLWLHKPSGQFMEDPHSAPKVYVS